MRLHGTAPILLPVLFLPAACMYERPPTEPTDSDRFTLNVAADSAPADAGTLVPVVVTVPSGARGEGRKVTLTTTAGSFPSGEGRTVTVVPDAGGTARAELRAPADTGTARVRATAAGAVREDVVRFAVALPERIELDASGFTLKAGLANQLSVTVYLRRSVGKVTPGMRVEVVGELPDGTRFGQASVAAPSGPDGAATVRFTAGDTRYRGPFMLRARLLEPRGSALSGSLVLHLVD